MTSPYKTNLGNCLSEAIKFKRHKRRKKSIIMNQEQNSAVTELTTLAAALSQSVSLYYTTLIQTGVAPESAVALTMAFQASLFQSFMKGLV